MGQKPIEIVLLRQLASYLAMPMMIFDVDGNLLFYNEPAEALLGLRFDETGEMPLAEWYRLLNLTDQDGSYLPLESRPLVIALKKRRAAHRALRFRSVDGVSRLVEATAFPLEGQGGRQLGAFVVIWEASAP
jgi:PAS domain-containing protein